MVYVLGAAHSFCKQASCCKLVARQVNEVRQAIGDKVDEFLKSGTVNKLTLYMEDGDVQAVQQLQVHRLVINT